MARFSTADRLTELISQRFLRLRLPPNNEEAL
jgi:hypothetical protein